MKIHKVIFILIFLVLTTSALSAQGKLELGFHYGPWGLNIIRGAIEDGLGDALEEQLSEKILEDIQEVYPGAEQIAYDQVFSFDSGGHNWGIELRYYPSGYNGSFSLGFSVEKTRMRVTFNDVQVNMLFSEGSTFEGDAESEYWMYPLSFHMSFRWDIVPTSKIRPYITVGFGIATGTALENGEISYAYSGDLYIEGQDPERFENTDSKTLKELKEELEDEGEDFVLPSIIPFIQLNLGLKAALTDNLHLLVDAGIWNGFLLRGGLAFRF